MEASFGFSAMGTLPCRRISLGCSRQICLKDASKAGPKKLRPLPRRPSRLQAVTDAAGPNSSSTLECDISAGQHTSTSVGPTPAMRQCSQWTASTTSAAVGASRGSIPSQDYFVIGLVVAQAVTLIGSLVGGHLARKRRIELQHLNCKLREVVHELRKQKEEAEQSLICEADPEEGVSAYQHALEASKASHPVQSYGMEGISLASARRKVSTLLNRAKTALEENKLDAALVGCQDALALSHELADKRAMRAILRVQARTQRASGKYVLAIRSLEDALQISKDLDEHFGDVDTLGMMADVHVELGNIEAASRLYDQVIGAIQVEDNTNPVSSSWDC